MTSIRSTVPTADRIGVDTRIDIGHVTFIATWPCLARAFDVKARGSAESELRLFVTLDGPADNLRGSLQVTVGGGDGEPRTLLERPMRGTIEDCNGWRIIELRCDGGPAIDALLFDEDRVEGRGDSARLGQSPGPIPTPSYVRTDVMALLGLDGGRYGVPSIELVRG